MLIGESIAQAQEHIAAPGELDIREPGLWIGDLANEDRRRIAYPGRACGRVRVPAEGREGRPPGAPRCVELADAIGIGVDGTAPWVVQRSLQHGRGAEQTGQRVELIDIQRQRIAEVDRFRYGSGRSQRITVPELVRTIAIEADIPARSVGLINIYDKFTFVEIPEEYAERVLGAMQHNTIRGHRINMEPAKAR